MKYKSSFDIWIKTRGSISKADSFNLLFPFLVGYIVFLFSYYLKFKFNFSTILEGLIALNGTILAIVITGFSIFNSSSNEFKNAAITSKAAGSEFSYFKHMMLNYFHVVCGLLIGTIAMLILYFFSFMTFDFDSESLSFMIFCHRFNINKLIMLKSLAITSIVIVQTYVLIKIKIFIFWIYDNSMSIAISEAIILNKKDPKNYKMPIEKEDM